MAPKKKRVTLRRVASEAGVSAPTASAVLHNTDHNNSGFSEETRQRVLDVARGLNYKPNRTVRNFTRRRHGALGVLVGPTGWMPEPTLAAMATAARAQDLMLVLDRGFRRDDIPLFVEEDAVDVLVVFGEIGPRLEKRVDELQVPTIHANSNRRRIPGSLTYDEAGGMKRLVQHLAETGRRRLLYVTTPLSTDHHYSVRERFDGMVTGCEDNGLPAPEVLEIGWPWEMGLTDECAHREEVVGAMQDFLAGSPDADAVVLCVRTYAPALYAAIRRGGLSIPDDLAVGAVNPFSPLDHMYPMLTSVTLDFGELGRQLVRMAHRAIERGTDGVEPVVFPMSLAVRDST